MKHPRFLMLVLTIWFVLSACTAAPTPTPLPPPSVMPTQVVIPASATPRPSATPLPSSTPVPPTFTQTLTNTPPPTATFTATVTSTPRPSFAGFQVDYTQFTNYGMLMGFHIPGLKENYRLKVNEIDYQCNLNDKAPDRLYCSGPQFKPGETVKLVFLPLKGSETPVYETSYRIVAYVTPTVDPRTLVAGGDKCAVRGVGVTCETEYRRDGDTYCIVATCVDLCGYYYSVDTCPEGSINNGFFPMTGTPPMPPIRNP